MLDPLVGAGIFDAGGNNPPLAEAGASVALTTVDSSNSCDDCWGKNVWLIEDISGAWTFSTQSSIANNISCGEASCGVLHNPVVPYE
jgi:hypothetical protein